MLTNFASRLRIRTVVVGPLYRVLFNRSLVFSLFEGLNTQHDFVNVLPTYKEFILDVVLYNTIQLKNIQVASVAMGTDDIKMIVNSFHESW